MNIFQNSRSDTGWSQLRWVRSIGAVAVTAAVSPVLLIGCASPRPPLPPSLKLPEVVSDLTASRVGDAVTLRWTTPSRTTDKLLIVGPVEAEICRSTPTTTPSIMAKSGSGTVSGVAQGAAKSTVTAPCSPVVQRVQVTPGASQQVLDPLPTALTAGPARLIAYRMQLRNAAGRTAGASTAAFTASGPAPQSVEELRGRATKAGIVLEWRPEAIGLGAASQTGAGAIELDRTILQPATTPTTATTATTSIAKATTAATATTSAAASSGSARKAGLTGAAKEPLEERLRVDNSSASAADAGGTIDRTVQIGDSYRYTAQRVRMVTVDEQKLEIRSVPSVGVTVSMQDVFPPDAPVDLVAIPGLASRLSGVETAAGQAVGQGVERAATQNQQPAIDLSWEPNMEVHVVGYRVYRRDLDSDAPDVWRLLDPQPLSMAAYRDLSGVAGQRYAYRVTAVSDTGYESARSNEVVETAPAQ